MKALLARLYAWRERRAQQAEAKWANRRYALNPEWKRRTR